MTPTAFVLTIPLHRDFTARNSDIAEILSSIVEQLDAHFEHVVEPDDRDTVMQDDRIIARWTIESTPGATLM